MTQPLRIEVQQVALRLRIACVARCTSLAIRFAHGAHELLIHRPHWSGVGLQTKEAQAVNWMGDFGSAVRSVSVARILKGRSAGATIGADVRRSAS